MYCKIGILNITAYFLNLQTKWGVLIFMGCKYGGGGEGGEWREEEGRRRGEGGGGTRIMFLGVTQYIVQTLNAMELPPPPNL